MEGQVEGQKEARKRYERGNRFEGNVVRIEEENRMVERHR